MVNFGGPPPEVEGALRRAGQAPSGPPPPIQGIAPGVGSLGGLPDWVRKGLDEQRRAREEEERREAERRAARERAEQAARERAAFEQLAAAERRAREAAAARQAEAKRAAEREAAQQAARERAQQAERERAAFEQLAAAERQAREAAARQAEARRAAEREAAQQAARERAEQAERERAAFEQLAAAERQARESAAARQVEAQRAAEREAAQRRAQQADREQVAFAELSKSEREARLKAMLNAPIQAIPSATGSLHDPNPQPRPQPRQVTPEPRWSPTAAEEQWYEQVMAQDAQAARSDAPSVAAAYLAQEQLMQEAEDRSRQAYRGGPSAYRALQREEQLMQEAAEHGEWAGFDRPARTSASYASSSEPVELGLGQRRGPPEEVVAYRTVTYDLTAEDLGGEEGPIDDSFETISKAWGRLNYVKTGGLAGEPDLTFGVIPGAPAYELFTHRLTVTQLLEADGTVRSFVTQRPLNEEAGWSLDAGRYDAKRTGGTSQVLYSHYDVEGRSPFATSYADVAVTVTDPGDGDLPRFEQNVKWHGVLRPEIRESADWWSRPSFSVIEGLAGKEIPDWLPDPLSPVSPLTKWGIEQVYDFDVEKSGGLSARGEVVEVGPWVLLPDRSQP